MAALTGRDTDRLAAEKARGISIELGFAPLDLPSGRRLGLVDVPGHERFVRHMVAGASGVDGYLLCVAADDGVMPQTREHLAVLGLLDVRDGVVAVTKADLRDPGPAERAARELVGAGAAVVAVSSRTGRGLDDLRAALDALAGRLARRTARGPARLFVDRCFTVAGAGTVVTGTLWGAPIEEGARVSVLPGGAEGRVRSVQAHDRPIERATGGRVAVNLAGVGRDRAPRGSCVVRREDGWVDHRAPGRGAHLAAGRRAPPAQPPAAGGVPGHGRGARDVRAARPRRPRAGRARLRPAPPGPAGARRGGRPPRAALLRAAHGGRRGGDRPGPRAPRPRVGGRGAPRRHRARGGPGHGGAPSATRTRAAGADRRRRPRSRGGRRRPRRGRPQPPATRRRSPTRLGLPEPRVTAALAGLRDAGRAVAAGGLWFDAAAAAGARAEAERALAGGPMGLGELRDLWGVSRRHALALAEHLDAQGVTRRMGDERVLRRGARSGRGDRTRPPAELGTLRLADQHVAVVVEDRRDLEASAQRLHVLPQS